MISKVLADQGVDVVGVVEGYVMVDANEIGVHGGLDALDKLASAPNYPDSRALSASVQMRIDVEKYGLLTRKL